VFGISSITGQCLVCIWLYPIQWLQGQIIFNTRYILLLLIRIFAREMYEIIITIDRFTCFTATDYTCFSLRMSKCVFFSLLHMDNIVVSSISTSSLFLFSLVDYHRQKKKWKIIVSMKWLRKRSQTKTTFMLNTIIVEVKW
jgi:hypothetical protein